MQFEIELPKNRRWRPAEIHQEAVVHTGTNTAGLIPKNLPNLPAKVALIFRLSERIADRLLCGTMEDRSSCFKLRASINNRSASLGVA